MSSFGEYIKNFSPSWFATVMGTGVFATSTYLLSFGYPIMLTLAHFITVLNFLMFFVILVPWTARWIFYPKNALADFLHPIRSNFYVTFGVGMLALSTNFFVVEKIPSVGLAFWIAGTIEVMINAFVYMFFVFLNRRIKLEDINPSMFIMTTGLFLIWGAGRAAIPYMRDIGLETLNITFDFTFGTAFFLYIGFQTIWLHRYILSEPLKSSQMPLFWINLGPIGAALSALLSPPVIVEFKYIALFFASLFWGYGIWWFILSVATTIYYAKRISMPYKTVWWAFTFPLGAYIIGTYYYAQQKNYTTLIYFDMAMYIMLFILWTITAALTLYHIIKGGIREKENLD